MARFGLPVVARLELLAVAELALGPPVLVVQLQGCLVGVTMGPDDGESDSHVRVVDRTCRLVDAMHGTDVAVLADLQGPLPLAFRPTILEDLCACDVSKGTSLCRSKLLA